jgi:hypothetical protein
VKRPSSRWTAAALALALSGCVDRPSLFDPEPRGEGPRIALPQGELEVYESDSIRVPVEGVEDADGMHLQLLVLDSTRAVLWRSAAVSLQGAAGEVPVEGVPAGVERGHALLVTGVLTDAAGHRLYASDDSVGAARLADAATRSLRVWAGKRVRIPDGGTPLDLALSPRRARAYFPIPGQSAVGTLDLAGPGVLGSSFAAGVRPDRLAYRSGLLAVLGAGGGSIGFMTEDAHGLSVPSEHPLQPLELELDTTFLGAVRPSGRGLAMGCAAADCTTVYAAVPSGLQAIVGSVPQAAAAGVVRVVPASPGPSGASVPPLLLPAYADVLRADTSLLAAVYSAAEPSGSRVLLQRSRGAAACLSTTLGDVLVAAGDDGVLYTAQGGASAAPCGPGTAIVRIDASATDSAAPSALGVRTTQADDRLAPARDLQLSEDGAALLVLTDEGVAVLDPYLRIRGTLAVAGARSIAWLRGGGASRFAVADTLGITVYDGERMRPVARIATGPTAGRMVYHHRSTGPDIIVATLAGGFVVAPVPAQ